MTNISNLSRSIGLSLVVALQGCSINMRNLGSQFDENAEVRVQVCLPNKRVHFDDIVLEQVSNHPLFPRYTMDQLDLVPKAIRRVAATSDPKAIHEYGIFYGEVLIFSGQFSDGSGFMPLRDSTVADQPIYEVGYGHPAKEYVAMHAQLPNSEIEAEGKVTYWFVLPKSIPNHKFTGWFKPISVEPEGQRLPLWWKLTHGGSMENYPVPTDSPKMRFSLLERHTKGYDPTTDSLPALSTARGKFKTETSGQQFVYEFVPKSDEVIPACD